MSHMLMRLLVELHALIKPSMREVTDISELISICEEVIDSRWGRKTAFTRTVSFHKRDDEPVKDRRTFEKRKPLSVPLHGSSNDLKPKEGRTCYKCKAPWIEGHRCKPMKINLVE